MPLAVQFGAGNIGRGFLGQLFYESGFDTVFVDVQDSLVEALNARGGYPLRIVDETTITHHIGRVRAIHGRDIAAVADALTKADIAATAVGVNVMDKIAASLAAGIARRFSDAQASPLDVIVCENMIHAGPFMRENVRGHLSGEHHAALDAKVGFVEASIGRMVPIMTAALKAEDPLLICAEAYHDLPVDAAAFKGPIPEIRGLQPRPDFGAYVERKLFVHNAGHAAAAYLGYCRGHEFIWQAMEDPAVRSVVEGAMDESGRALFLKWGLDPHEMNAHTDDLLRRFHNKGLGDQVERVGKDPVRKLGPNDRLVGAATLCLNQGINPRFLAVAIAGALRYDAPDDPSALYIQQLRADGGIPAVLADVSGIPAGHPLIDLVEETDNRLEAWMPGVENPGA